MTFAQKKNEDAPSFREVHGRIWEKFHDRLRIYRDPEYGALTSFGANRIAVAEFGRRLREFEDCEEIVVNDIGLGIERRPGITVREKSLTMRNVSFEIFELVNQAMLGKIEPERIRFCGIDERRDILLAVKSMKEVRVDIKAKGFNKEYFQEFFPGFHREEEGGYLPVRIPNEWRRRIECFELNIKMAPAPEKAHITFSYMYVGEHVSSTLMKNLAGSTRRGGYVMTYCPTYSDIWEEAGLENLGPAGGRIEKEGNITKILLPEGSRIGTGSCYQGIFRVK